MTSSEGRLVVSLSSAHPSPYTLDTAIRDVVGGHRDEVRIAGYRITNSGWMDRPGYAVIPLITLPNRVTDVARAVAILEEVQAYLRGRHPGFLPLLWIGGRSLQPVPVRKKRRMVVPRRVPFYQVSFACKADVLEWLRTAQGRHVMTDDQFGWSVLITRA